MRALRLRRTDPRTVCGLRRCVTCNATIRPLEQFVFRAFNKRQSMDFQERLEKAIQRGQRTQDAEARAPAQQAMGEEELKRLHSQYRLELSEHIEQSMRQLAQQFPGFRFETLVGSAGWG